MTEHPEVYQTRLTGYPRPEPTIQSCEHCQDELYDSYLVYDDSLLCEATSCLETYLLNQGVITKVGI